MTTKGSKLLGNWADLLDLDTKVLAQDYKFWAGRVARSAGESGESGELGQSGERVGVMGLLGTSIEASRIRIYYISTG